MFIYTNEWQHAPISPTYIRYFGKCSVKMNEKQEYPIVYLIKCMLYVPDVLGVFGVASF